MSAPAPIGPHVLVVDDDRAFRHVIATLLQKAGYVTDQTGDGADALARLEADAGRPDAARHLACPG